MKDAFKAKGLEKAREKLQYESLSEEEKKMYDRFQENRRIENSVTYTAKRERSIEIAKKLISSSLDNEFIAKVTDLTIEHIEQLHIKIKSER